nr:MAG TPA: hypothetical protein [Caudoviricetes sp.]
MREIGLLLMLVAVFTVVAYLLKGLVLIVIFFVGLVFWIRGLLFKE